MIQVRRSEDRGHLNHGWLDTYHTFSFGEYFDPAFMGFRSLRVINEDSVQPGMGFGTHGHRDMEIITYVLEGELAHKDSMGNGSTIVPGEVQRMSAGTGVRHSEFNHSRSDRVHFLQIWVLPEKEGIEPSYQQKFFADEEKIGKLRLIASPTAEGGSVNIHQDARVYATILGDGQSVEHSFGPGRYGWVQVAKGEAMVGDKTLRAGDGAAITEEDKVTITGNSTRMAEVLLFDMA